MHLFILLIYSLCLALFLPIFFPSLHLFFFAPFLILTFYHSSFSKSLWWSLACGFLIDLLSSQMRLGTYAANYCLATCCLYSYKFHFFEDRLSTLPVMTFCLVMIITLIQAAIFYVIGKPFFISWEWIKNDLIFSPFQNALYASCAFTFPTLLISHLKRRSSLFLGMKRRKS